MNPSLVRLKHLLRKPLAYGVLKPDKFDGLDGIPLVRIMDVARGTVEEGSLEKISPTQSEEFRRTVLNAGDLVCSVVGTIGETFIAPDSLAGANLSRALARIQLDRHGHTRYVQYVIQSPEFHTFVALNTDSTAQTVLNLGTLGDVRIPVSDVQRQERIANFLDEQTARIDALIAEKEALRSAVKEYFDARLGTAVAQGLNTRAALVPAEAYGYVRIRADWRLVPLKHLVYFSGGMTPSKDNDLFWTGDIPWVSPKDMKRFVLPDSEDHVSELALSNTSLKLQPPGSVLVVVRGMILAHSFPVAINSNAVTINQDMKAMRPKSQQISELYLAWMLRGLKPLMLSLTEESAHGTKVLRTDQWANQAMPVPSTEEQAALVKQFERWEAEATELLAHLLQHIERLREYRSSLISAAVTGQLDISTYARKAAAGAEEALA